MRGKNIIVVGISLAILVVISAIVCGFGHKKATDTEGSDLTPKSIRIAQSADMQNEYTVIYDSRSQAYTVIVEDLQTGKVSTKTAILEDGAKAPSAEPTLFPPKK